LDLNFLENMDHEIANAINMEIDRQKNTLELIASENIASPAVMAVQGSIFTNKYAEGYPDKRYYGGCEYVDIAEKLAVNRAKKLFNAPLNGHDRRAGNIFRCDKLQGVFLPVDLHVDCIGNLMIHILKKFRVQISFPFKRLCFQIPLK